jgi:hypothetical protein
MEAMHELSRYDSEFKERMCKHKVEIGKSATSVREELGIDKTELPMDEKVEFG